jgi:hypothetical protein
VARDATRAFAKTRKAQGPAPGRGVLLLSFVRNERLASASADARLSRGSVRRPSCRVDAGVHVPWALHAERALRPGPFVAVRWGVRG